MKINKKIKKPFPKWAKWTIFSISFLLALALIGIMVWQLVLSHVK